MNVTLQNTWHIIGLIGAVVALRVAVPNVRGLRQRAVTWCVELADSVLIALLLVFCIIRPFVIQSFYIPSGSMRPTLQERDRILVNRLVYRLRAPRPGEIVVFRAPQQALEEGEPPRDFIKRCVGGPGDVVEVRDGMLWRNGKPVHERALVRRLSTNPSVAYEPYMIQEEPAYGWAPHTVPPGHIFTFGDNRNNSNDSHRWLMKGEGGYREAPSVPTENVLGKAMVIFWPLDRIRVLR